MLTETLAAEIVEETMVRLHRNINIMDERGVIIASGDPDRINQIHPGAKEVLKTGQTVAVREQDGGARPGINLPITFKGKMIGVIGITGNPDELAEFGELVRMSTEMMVRQAFLTEQTEWQQHTRELIFNDYISFPLDEESISQRLELLEMKMAGPFQIAAAEVELNDMKRKDVLNLVYRHFSEHKTLCGFLGMQRIFILASDLEEHTFKEKLLDVLHDFGRKGMETKIGVGSSATEAEQIRHIYEEALCALKLGTAHGIVSYSEIEIKALISRMEERARRQFSQRVLQHVPDKLIETIEKFNAHNLNIGKCAESMFIHRNSLNYRLKKIEELTGYDPRDFYDAMTLQLAIWIQRLDEA